MKNTKEQEIEVRVTKVERSAPSKVQVAFEISAPNVAGYWKRKINHYRRNTIKGFRPGNAPDSIVLQYYAEHVKYDTGKDLVNDALPKVIAAADAPLLPTDRPRLMHPLKVNPARPLTATIVYDTHPNVEVGVYTALRLTVPPPPPINVKAELLAIQHKYATLHPRGPKDSAKMGNAVKITVHTTDSTDSTDNTNAPLTQQYILGARDAPAFTAKIVGMKRGQSKTIENYHVTVLDIMRVHLPSINDAFVAQLNIEARTVSELKAHLTTRLTNDRNSTHYRQKCNALMEAIVQSSTYELPESMVAHELQRMLRQFLYQRNAQKQDDPQDSLPEEYIAQLLKEWRPQAQKHVIHHIIQMAIIEKEQLELTEDEVEEGVGTKAAELGVTPEELRNFYNSRNAMHVLKEELQRHKLFNWLISHSTIVDK